MNQTEFKSKGIKVGFKIDKEIPENIACD